MAAAGQDMHSFVQTTIPKALADLMDSNNNIKQIATYCKSAYLSSGEQSKVYDQTREYTKECILNVAYHVQTIGTHLSTLLDLQTSEIDKLDIQIRALSDRVKACHEATGATAFRVKEANKVYNKSSKVRKLEGSAVPEAALAPRKYTRQAVNYQLIESGGSPLSSSTSSSSSFSSTPSSSYSSPALAPAPAPTYFQGGHGRASVALGAPPTLSAPPTFSAPPPSLSAPPPIPSFSAAPPSLGGPPPPPPSAFPPPPPPSFDMPPPPPPSFDFDMPPPPPPGLDFDNILS